jgi:hypothetical protein
MRQYREPIGICDTCHRELALSKPPPWDVDLPRRIVRCCSKGSYNPNKVSQSLGVVDWAFPVF